MRKKGNPYKGKKGINKKFIDTDGKERFIVGCRAWNKGIGKNEVWGLTVLRCPYCGDNHIHGSNILRDDEMKIGMTFGARSADCGGRDYYLTCIEIAEVQNER